MANTDFAHVDWKFGICSKIDFPCEFGNYHRSAEDSSTLRCYAMRNGK
jgi:hypothetical protein